MSWGPRVRIFVVEQEYLGRFGEQTAGWTAFRDRLERFEGSRTNFLRIEKLSVADIGSVVFAGMRTWLVANVHQADYDEVGGL